MHATMQNSISIIVEKLDSFEKELKFSETPLYPWCAQKFDSLCKIFYIVGLFKKSKRNQHKHTLYFVEHDKTELYGKNTKGSIDLEEM